MIQRLADYLFSDAWKQCKEKYDYAVKSFGLENV